MTQLLNKSLINHKLGSGVIFVFGGFFNRLSDINGKQWTAREKWKDAEDESAKLRNPSNDV